MASEQVLKQKKQVVSELKNHIINSSSIIVWQYRGLPVSTITEIKKELKDVGAFTKVYKNNLAKLAFKETGYDVVDKLVGPNAFAFTSDDEIASARILAKFKKHNEDIIFNVGIFEDQVIDEGKIQEIASIPSREGLISMFLYCLQTPLQNLAYILKQIEKKKEV